MLPGHVAVNSPPALLLPGAWRYKNLWSGHRPVGASQRPAPQQVTALLLCPNPNPAVAASCWLTKALSSALLACSVHTHLTPVWPLVFCIRMHAPCGLKYHKGVRQCSWHLHVYTYIHTHAYYAVYENFAWALRNTECMPSPHSHCSATALPLQADGGAFCLVILTTTSNAVWPCAKKREQPFSRAVLTAEDRMTQYYCSVTYFFYFGPWGQTQKSFPSSGSQRLRQKVY